MNAYLQSGRMDVMQRMARCWRSSWADKIFADFAVGNRTGHATAIAVMHIPQRADDALPQMV